MKMGNCRLPSPKRFCTSRSPWYQWSRIVSWKVEQRNQRDKEVQEVKQPYFVGGLTESESDNESDDMAKGILLYGCAPQENLVDITKLEQWRRKIIYSRRSGLSLSDDHENDVIQWS